MKAVVCRSRRGQCFVVIADTLAQLDTFLLVGQELGDLKLPGRDSKVGLRGGNLRFAWVAILRDKLAGKLRKQVIFYLALGTGAE